MNNDDTYRKMIAELRVAVGAVDVVLFTITNGELRVLLIPVHRPPHYVHLFGLPGGVIGMRETGEIAATRHLKEKAGITGAHIEQLCTFTDPDRDRRSRAISIAYMALVSSDTLSESKDAVYAWVSLKKLPPLAYDHALIISTALERLQGKLSYTSIAANLLPKYFTLAELQVVYETILSEKIDKRNFRKKMVSSGLVKPTGKQKKTLRKPAQLFSFVR